jgi:hypothetical protein
MSEEKISGATKLEKIFWIILPMVAISSFLAGWAVALVKIARNKNLRVVPDGHSIISNAQLLALFNSVPTSVKINLANQTLKEESDEV